jgi:D-alanine-D-alanine ligase
MEIEREDFGRIGVLMGGPSSEREISLHSGQAVFDAFREAGLDAVSIQIETEDKEENIELIRSYNIDCAFVALHGRFGEDGQIQDILEAINIPYTGSGVRASRLAMDKVLSNQIFESAGLCIPRYQVLEKGSYKGIRNFEIDSFGLPLVVKPATHGSSIGLSIVEKLHQLANALDSAFSFDERVIIQEYIGGRELTVGILEDRALPVIEVVPKRKFFDYAAKYTSGLTEYIVPAKLDEGQTGIAQEAAVTAHRLLGCFGCSRVDMILSEDKKIFVLEINTIPGFTNTSLLPKAARVVGIEFLKLCLLLIKLAYEKTKVNPAV